MYEARQHPSVSRRMEVVQDCRYECWRCKEAKRSYLQSYFFRAPLFAALKATLQIACEGSVLEVIDP